MREEQQVAWVCQRCGSGEGRLPFAPWPGELGRRIQGGICQSCWNEWIGLQTQIINEYRLNVLDPGHAKAVRDQMEAFLGFKQPDGDVVDG